LTKYKLQNIIIDIILLLIFDDDQDGHHRSSVHLADFQWKIDEDQKS